MNSHESEYFQTRDLKESLLNAGVLEKGHYFLASGRHSLFKLEMDHLWEPGKEKQLDFVLRSLAEFPGLPPADAILGVPSGGQRIAEALVANYLKGIPLIRLKKRLGGGRYDFDFFSEVDKEIAEHARSLRICEDVVSTLGSVAGVAKLRGSYKEIHSVAIWRRGVVDPRYQMNVKDHYLVEEEIPDFSPEECPYCKIPHPM